MEHSIRQDEAHEAAQGERAERPPAVWSSALKSLVRGGRLVTRGATSGDQPGADLRRMFIRQLQVLGSTMGTLAELGDLLAVCAQGRVRPVIDRRYPLEAVPDALNRTEAAEQFGKLAIVMSDEASNTNLHCT